MDVHSNCCGGATNVCDSTIAELPRYYPRQLITPDDLTLEQNYFRDRMRRHNRLLHGWGVVCGALVCPVTTQDANGVTSFTAWQVQVQPGYVLGPYGDEIILDCPRTVDLRTNVVSGVTGEPCIDAPDPWCTQVYTSPSATQTLYIAVKYTQCMARPVRVQPIGCGCDDTSCEYSRWKDGYEIGVLQTCPVCNACDKTLLQPPNLQDSLAGPIPTCPDCSCGPWVCLAQVALSSDGSGTIHQIDNYACRRLVASFSNVWWRATQVSSSAEETSNQLAPGTPGTVTVTANNLDLVKEHYVFDPAAGVTVQSAAWASGTNPGSSVKLTVTATNIGSYALTVVKSDCSTLTFVNAISVVGPSPPAGTAQTGQARTTAPAQAKVSAARPTPKPAAKKTPGRSRKA